MFCTQALFPKDEVLADKHPLMAQAATNDRDTFHHHQAMKQPDKEQFMRAMEKEFNDQHKNENFDIIPKSKVPDGERILPSVWNLRRKKRILTGEVFKWKG